MPEIIPSKIILPQPEENFSPKNKKAEPPITSTSGISESSKTFEHIDPSNKKASSISPARQEMMADADVIDIAKENKINPNDLFYMTRRERLISEEIYLQKYANVRKPWEYVYDDEEWQKNISILQENATDFMERYKWTFETPLSELAQYTEKINKSLRDDCKVRSNAKTRFQQLGLTKKQVEVLIPI
ncbi:hypothetical protein RclHR1_19270001 [Rhizophagus clarus]|uniref:Uncharacterized protein n=1 Tax=Rhizophagus clarus TaxID=94130 RepID=A0A2Z6R1D9_9GLOM|nr:hypothetical protein RclHR1_19270001 [Rhizophagus clarus]